MWLSKYYVCVLKPNNKSLRRYEHLKLWNCTKTKLVRTYIQTLYLWSVITPMIFCHPRMFISRYYFRWQWSFVPETCRIAKLIIRHYEFGVFSRGIPVVPDSKKVFRICPFGRGMSRMTGMQYELIVTDHTCTCRYPDWMPVGCLVNHVTSFTWQKLKGSTHVQQCECLVIKIQILLLHSNIVQENFAFDERTLQMCMWTLSKPVFFFSSSIFLASSMASSCLFFFSCSAFSSFSALYLIPFTRYKGGII